MLSAGRVLIKPEGDYSPLKTYEMLDYVSYNGSSYIAKKTTTGNLPTDTEYWQLSASGAQSQNVTSNFAEVEGSDIASSPHAIDDVFVNKDGKLLKATLAISIGDTIVIDTNCEPTTVEDLISYLSTQVSTLDSSNKKLNGITEIAVQTDLHTLDLGEFYKDKTSFYVTNGPEEVDEVASAIFRLTVESALDGSSTTRLLTLKTPGGKVYTQNYDGSSWGDWEQVASESEVELLTNETYNVNDTAITEVASHDILPIYDTSATGKKKIAVSNFIGGLVSNPNLLDNPWFTVNQRGQSSYTGDNIYTLDRWKLYTFQLGTPTLTVGTNGISITNATAAAQSARICTLCYFTEQEDTNKLIGKQVTASILYADGHIDSATVTIPSRTSSVQTVTAIRNSNNGALLQIIIRGTSETLPDQLVRLIPFGTLSIRAIKIELGSVSTLAMDTVPNYATELLKCQRYFINVIGNGASGYFNGANAILSVPVPVQMRTVPTVTLAYANNIIDATGNIIAVPANATVTATQNQKNAVRITVPTSRTATVILPCVNADTSFNFSADL